MTAPHMLSRIPLFLSLFLLFGCAPYINSYYLPESTEGYRSGHSVRAFDEPIWILERDGATFYFSAGRDGAGHSIFKLNIQPLRLPGEDSFSAQKRQEARLAVKPITVEFAKLREGPLVTSGVTEKNAGNVEVVKGQYGTNNRSVVKPSTNEIHLLVDHFLELSAFFQNSESELYVVEWPSMIINGKLVQVPPVQFAWKSGVQVQFVNG